MRLLRDIDDGFWRFCTSCNDIQQVFPPSDDPVAEFVLRAPWQPTHVSIYYVEALRRPGTTWSLPVAGKKGLIYHVIVSTYGNGYSGHFRYEQLLESTRSLREHIVHICFVDFSLFHVTLPSVLGADEIIRIVDRFVTAAASCHLPGFPRLSDSDVDPLEKLANKWPEHVLGPNDPLTFLAPDMPCSLFRA